MTVKNQYDIIIIEVYILYLHQIHGGAVMDEQVLNQFRCDKALREECAAIYSAMGMYLNTAFRMFMERARMVGGLPFPAVLPESKKLR